MRPLENKQGVGFQRRGGHRHSIVQANYQWKIITTDGSRAANLCRSTLALENRWWNVRVLLEGLGGCVLPLSHTHTQLHTPDVNFHKDSLICALWPPLVPGGLGIPDNSSVNTSMCLKEAWLSNQSQKQTRKKLLQEDDLDHLYLTRITRSAWIGSPCCVSIRTRSGSRSCLEYNLRNQWKLQRTPVRSVKPCFKWSVLIQTISFP